MPLAGSTLSMLGSSPRYSPRSPPEHHERGRGGRDRMSPKPYCHTPETALETVQRRSSKNRVTIKRYELGPCEYSLESTACAYSLRVLRVSTQRRLCVLSKNTTGGPQRPLWLCAAGSGRPTSSAPSRTCPCSEGGITVRIIGLRVPSRTCRSAEGSAGRGEPIPSRLVAS